MKRSVPERAITEHEVAIIEWLLDHVAMGDVSAYRGTPTAELRVVGGCACGCSSLYFREAGSGGYTMLADAVAAYNDEKKCGLILWGRIREIAWLEVYPMEDVANRVPEISDLRRYEDLFSDS